MDSNYFLLPSASLLLLQWTVPAPCPCPRFEAISQWKKSKDTSKIPAPTVGGHFPLTRFYKRPLLFEALRHLLHNKLFAGRTSWNPFVHCTTGPVGRQSGGPEQEAEGTQVESGLPRIKARGSGAGTAFAGGLGGGSCNSSPDT